MHPIRAIDQDSVHKICSSQVILDLAMAVKELVENSLDAGATVIDVKFKDQGLDSIEVSDNGSGVHVSNHDTLALKHHTSKLQSFDDLARVDTFGFRGEALSSLCSLGDLVVTTATKDTAPRGTRLQYDASGKLVSQNAVARSMGTTVQISNFLYSLTVRQGQFKRNIKREYAKALSILQAYALISQGTRFTVTNLASRGSQGSKVLATTANNSVRENIVNVFGTKMASHVVPFSVQFTVKDEKKGVKIQGFISKPVPGSGRSSTDRQYMFVNGRPCDLPKISKAVNDAYRSIVPSQYPFLLADIQLSPSMYDVNVSPDKRSVLLHDEREIIDELTDGITRELMATSTVEIHSQQEITNSMSQRTEPRSPTQTSSTSIEQRAPPPQQPLFESAFSRQDNQETAISRRTLSTSGASNTASESTASSNTSWLTTLQDMAARNERRTVGGRTKKRQSTLFTHVTSTKRQRTPSVQSDDEEDTVDASNSSMRVSRAPVPGPTMPDSIPKQLTSSKPNDNQAIEEDEAMADELNEDEYENENEDRYERSAVSSSSSAWRTSNFERSIRIVDEDVFLERLERKLGATTIGHAINGNGNGEEGDTQQVLVKAANVSNLDDTAAVDALSRVIHKADFARMKVVGQFNDSFILVMLDDYDLFIVDQHASDEKYNFEDLRANTPIKGQRLVVPHVPNLTAVEELVAMENAHILRANGFDISVDAEGSMGQKIRVLSQPMSDAKLFDSKDFSELIHSLTEQPGRMVTCRRLRDVYASRACRKSKMFGDPLKYKEMVQIICHMGELDHPWNCPHGRPTLRHMYRFQPNRQNAPQRPITFQGTIFTHHP